jgi:hypothetical protein
MLTALEARFADRPLTIQALVPENMAPVFFAELAGNSKSSTSSK